MSTYDVDPNIRIVIPSRELTDQVRRLLLDANAAPSKDMETWTIDIAADTAATGVENAIEQSLAVLAKLRHSAWWAPAWAVSVWVTISSQREFAGLVVPASICKQASELGVDLVFSVYCSQET